MSPDEWITVPNWDKFQHYKDRVPPWIKLHLEILDKPEIDALTHAQMGVLIRVWALYARCRGTLSVQKVCSAVGDANTQRHLKRLNDAGLIELSASKPLAQRRKELREEKNTDFQISEPPNGVVDEGALQLAHEWLERHAMPA
jgi:DNA-binding transcriptional ArsR family regulator